MPQLTPACFATICSKAYKKPFIVLATAVVKQDSGSRVNYMRIMRPYQLSGSIWPEYDLHEKVCCLPTCASCCLLPYLVACTHAVHQDN